MGNFLFGLPGISYTPTASSEDSDHPATNLKLYGNIHEDYRSEVVTSVNIVFDLGANFSGVKLALDACNFTDFNLQANSTDSWASPTVDDDITQIAKPWVQPSSLVTGVQHRYGYFWEPAGFTNLRYIRLLIDAQTPTDGADYFRIGRAGILASTMTVTLNQNPSEFEEDVDSPTGLIEYPNGETAYSLGDDLRWKGSLGWSAFLKSNVADLQALTSLPKDRVLVMFLNHSSSKEDFYFCRRRNSFVYQHQLWGAAQVRSIDFVEAL